MEHCAREITFISSLLEFVVNIYLCLLKYQPVIKKERGKLRVTLENFIRKAKIERTERREMCSPPCPTTTRFSPIQSDPYKQWAYLTTGMLVINRTSLFSSLFSVSVGSNRFLFDTNYLNGQETQDGEWWLDWFHGWREGGFTDCNDTTESNPASFILCLLVGVLTYLYCLSSLM